MRNDVKEAVKAVRAYDPAFNASKASETDDYIVLHDSKDGIPPYIVGKGTNDVHQVVIGVKRDMDIAFKESVFIEDLR